MPPLGALGGGIAPLPPPLATPLSVTPDVGCAPKTFRRVTSIPAARRTFFGPQRTCWLRAQDLNLLLF